MTVRFGTALMLALICILMGVAGLGYVWQKKQTSKLGESIKEKETELSELQSHNRELELQFFKMCSPNSIEGRIKELGLSLIKPTQDQILYFTNQLSGIPLNHYVQNRTEM